MGIGHQVAMALRTAYWTMHRQADACLQPLGVSANQFVLLSLLAEQDGVTQQQIVQRASSDPNTVRAMLIALEGKGLVVRKEHPTDGRAWSVILSAKGRRKYDKLWVESEEFRQRLRAAIQPEEAAILLKLLNRVSEVMGSGRQQVETEQGGR